VPKISEDFVKTFSLGQTEEKIVRDSKLTGFALRVRRKADGTLSRTFMIVYELPSADDTRKRRKLVIGDYPTFSAEVARREAQAMLQAVALGDDPAAARSAKKASPLFTDLIDEFETGYLAEKQPATRKDYQGRIRRNLKPEFGKFRVMDITSTMVSAFIRKKRANPVDANRSIAVMSKMFGYAAELGWRSDNPCRGLKRYQETAREAWLDEHDLPKFVKTLADLEGGCAELLRFLTVTGWRVTEARLLTWDMVDLQRLIARLPQTKTGAAVRALSSDAATLIDRQKHRVGFVFGDANGIEPIGYKRVRETLASICKAADVQMMTPHGLRHTAATWSAISGAEAHELREAFGWKTLAMTARYVSRSESLARRGAQRAADAMNVLGKSSADVMELKR
jgi:integrase